MGHVACTGEMGNEYTVLVRKLEGKKDTTWKDLCVYGMILECILGSRVGSELDACGSV
jgi:hypothetical protein